MYRPTTSLRREQRTIIEVGVLVVDGLILGMLLPFIAGVLASYEQTPLPPLAMLASAGEWARSLACLAPLILWLPMTLPDGRWAWVLRQIYIFVITAGLIGVSLYSAYQIAMP
jgi:hypothetical protein